jgi:hypothetical protein
MTRPIPLLLTLVLGCLAGAPATPAVAADGFAFREQPGQHLDVVLDGRTIARYMFAFDTSDATRQHETYKPYLHVMDAEGNQPITKGPGGQYTHHRGIFIGWNRISLDGQRYDLWHMSGGPQVHEKFADRQAGPDQASFTSQVAWNAKDGTTLLKEKRRFVFHRVPAPALLAVDVTSQLTAVAGDLVLDGDPEHAGIQYRPADQVDRKQTTYLFPTDDIDPKKDRDMPWVGETYHLGEHTYSVVELNDVSDNPQGTVWSAYRDYGRFGAFPRIELPRGETVTLRYGFRVKTGDLPTRDHIQECWRKFSEG